MVRIAAPPSVERLRWAARSAWRRRRSVRPPADAPAPDAMALCSSGRAGQSSACRPRCSRCRRHRAMSLAAGSVAGPAAPMPAPPAPASTPPPVLLRPSSRTPSPIRPSLKPVPSCAASSSRSPPTTRSCAAPAMSRSCCSAPALGHDAIAVTDRNTPGRHRPRAPARRRARHPAGGRLPARPARRPVAAGLPDRPRRLCAPVPAAQPRQVARRQGRLRPRLGRPRRRVPRGSSPSCCPSGREDGRRPAADLARLRDVLRRPRLVRAHPARAARTTAPACAAPRRCAAPRVATVVTGDVLYHVPDAAHPPGRGHLHPRGLHHRRGRLPARPLADRHLKRPRRDGAPVRARPGARWPHPDTSLERCRFSLSELRYQYPEESETPGLTDAAGRWSGWPARALPVAYPDGVPDASRTQVAHELALIASSTTRPTS